MEINKVGVLGCGLMGSGIAQTAASAGCDVIVREVTDELCERGFSMPAKPRSHNSSVTSRTITSQPALAAVCAIPAPIRPQPSTPTLLISIFQVLPFS